MEEWEGARRFAVGQPSASNDDSAHRVVIPLRRAAWYTLPLLAVVGLVLVGVFVAAAVVLVSGQARPWAGSSWLRLIPLSLFGALGAFMLGAIPATVRSMEPGRRWLLTLNALVTTNLTVRWNDNVDVGRVSVCYPIRFWSGGQHFLGVTLREHADVTEISEDRFDAVLSNKLPPYALAPCDMNTLGVDPERVAAAIALLVARPDLRPLLATPSGVRLVCDPEGASEAGPKPQGRSVDGPRSTHTASSVRLESPALASAPRTCDSTVRTERNSRVAICWLVSPCATSPATSDSRAVRVDSGAGPGSRPSRSVARRCGPGIRNRSSSVAADSASGRAAANVCDAPARHSARPRRESAT